MNWKALQFMIISTLAFAFMNVLVKYLGNYSTFQLIFFRGLITLILCTSLIVKNKIPILGNNIGLLVFRGLAGTISLSLFFYALKFVPLGSAVTIRYLGPVFGIILSILFLKEKVKPIQFLFLLIAIIGAALIKGFDARISLFGLAIILSSAFFIGLVFTLLRKIGNSEHYLVIINYFMLTTVVVGLIGSIGNWQTPAGTDLLLLLSLGFIGFVGQVYMTKAFQIEETNRVAPLKYLEAIFVLILSFIWFDEGHHWLSLLGMLMIVLGITLNSLISKKA